MRKKFFIAFMIALLVITSAGSATTNAVLTESPEPMIPMYETDMAIPDEIVPSDTRIICWIVDLFLANENEAYFEVCDYFGVHYYIMLMNPEEFDPNRWTYYDIEGYPLDSPFEGFTNDSIQKVYVEKITSLTEFDADNLERELFYVELPVG